MAIIKKEYASKLCKNTITDFNVLKIALTRNREQDCSRILEETDRNAWVVLKRSRINKERL